MSAGVFLKSRYAARYGTGAAIHPIRVQPETVTLAIGGIDNAPPTGAINNPISALVSRNRRAKGLIAALVVLRAPATGQPPGYQPLGLTRIPLLTQAMEDAATNWTEGTEIAYNGVTGWTVFGSVVQEVAK